MRIPLITLMLGSLLLPLAAQAAKPGAEAG